MWARNAFQIIVLLHLSIQPEEEVAVPPFGEWDDSNAASGEKYTGIFNRVRDDRLSPSTSRQPSTTRGEENKEKQVCYTVASRLVTLRICYFLDADIIICILQTIYWQLPCKISLSNSYTVDCVQICYINTSV